MWPLIEEGEPAEHPLLGDVLDLRQLLAKPLGELLVVGHARTISRPARARHVCAAQRSWTETAATGAALTGAVRAREREP